MNGDADHFESLRRLLALKRHEQPPPGYFQNFSSRVLARIEAGETGEGARVGRTWLQWLWAPIEQRPVFAGAFGAAVCALLIAGIFNTEEGTATNTISHQIPPVAFHPPNQTKDSVVPATPDPAIAASLPSPPGVILVSSTNSDMSVQEMFNRFQLRALPAKFELDLMGTQ